MAPDDTKERILDAAERLFADHGFAATSLRAITSGAGVNLAAVHYHFGSKEALIQAVFERRIGPLNRRRLELLDRVEAACEGGLPPIRPIVEAFVGPALRMSQDPARGGETFMRLLGHTYGEPSEQIGAMFHDQFREVAARFQAALHRAIPRLSREDLFWRLMFMVGAMAHAMGGSRKVIRAFLGEQQGPDVEELMERLVPFLVAGLDAPAPVANRGARP